ncbi:hypothetical protein [Photorhabdus australis]|uniref:hypothetical protein n=1 Tax=Photorhabdus australis TaxID=286156 RepID=UPI0030D91045
MLPGIRSLAVAIHLEIYWVYSLFLTDNDYSYNSSFSFTQIIGIYRLYIPEA